jgi:hypothetical protein
MNHPVEFASGAFRNTTLQPDRWEQTTGRSYSQAHGQLFLESNSEQTPVIKKIKNNPT